MKKLLFIIIILAGLTVKGQVPLIDRYEYWFNQDEQSSVSVSLTPVAQANIQLSLGTATLPEGLNSFTIRFRDTEDAWSAPLTRFFVKLPATENGGSQKQIVAWAYCFNQDEMVMQALTPSESISVDEMISATALPDGLNSFSARFQDNTGAWSSMLTRFFVKVPQTEIAGQEKQIVGYEYWLNQSEAIWETVTPGVSLSLSEVLGVSELPEGLNTFSLRFKDNTGAWSSVLSRFFVKQPLASGNGEDAAIAGYQIWFNNNFEAAIEENFTGEATFSLVETLTAADLPNGLNNVSIRFKDNRGQWSSVLSKFFVKNPVQENEGPNLMTAYEYWLEDAEGNLFDTNGQEGRVLVTLEEPINPLLLDLDLDLRMIPHGNYSLMFRFLDIRGSWSSVLSSEIVKNALPFAYFEAEQTTFCGYGEVTFYNFSVDADEFAWSINGGIVSYEPELANYQLNGPGLYTVSLTATWSETGESHTYTVEDMIVVHTLPEVLINSDGALEFCDGGSVVLSSSMEGIYQWATGETTQEITVTETGDYWLLFTDENQCEIYVGGVFVTVFELPDAQVLLPENGPWCDGEEIVIVAYPDDSSNSFLWSTGETTSEISIDQSGDYWVEVTDYNQCTAQSPTEEVIFHPLPEPSFSYEVNNYLASFNNTSQGAATYYWDFGDGTHSTEMNPEHQYTSAGAFEICLTATSAAGCIETHCQTMSITVGINQPGLLSSEKVYPVPFSQYLNISLPNGHQWQVIQVISVSGRVITRMEAPEGQALVYLSTAEWDPGLYLILLTSRSGEQTTLRAIKQ
ncbi:MAG: PKD domain-containing protein [Bacteroides sp.]|jgi:PKD repeat protein|nr:PKD domain-containing protein [Bacteroides sp.]